MFSTPIDRNYQLNYGERHKMHEAVVILCFKSNHRRLFDWNSV